MRQVSIRVDWRETPFTLQDFIHIRNVFIVLGTMKLVEIKVNGSLIRKVAPVPTPGPGRVVYK